MGPIEKLKEQGRLEVFRMERAQIPRHVRAALQDLKEARATFSVSDKAAYLFAYTAMLKIGRALLFLKGYRPKGLGQHEAVVEAAGFILGPEFKSLTLRFDRMRKKRNRLLYDIGGLVSHSEAEVAFKTAEEYLEKVQRLIEEEDPQLKLRFE